MPTSGMKSAFILGEFALAWDWYLSAAITFRASLKSAYSFPRLSGIMPQAITVSKAPTGLAGSIEDRSATSFRLPTSPGYNR
jgi:hypothetical protein